MTEVREMPSRSAIRALGTPSAASLLISAQSSKVITLQSSSVHFSPPKLFSFRAPSTVTNTGELTVLILLDSNKSGIEPQALHSACRS
jgi:hypothetical protein